MLAGAALLLTTLAGCGYAVNSGFDPSITSVAVPVFESASFRRGTEIRLTEAVQQQIVLRTPFRLARESTADTVLRGRVVDLSKRPLTTSPTDDPRELEFRLAVEVLWEDRRDGRTLAVRRFPITPDVVPLVSTGGQGVYLGETRVTAEREAVDRMARQIVDLMELPW